MRNETDSKPMSRSLISRKTPVKGATQLTQIDEVGTLNLRLSDDRAIAAASTVLGVEVPTRANTFGRNGNVIVLWLGPNEWMLQAPIDDIGSIQQKLEASLSGHHVSVTEVTDHSVAMELSGNAARKVLEKGCPIDLHSRVFGPGQCVQSHFLQAVVILAQLDENRYLLRVRRSMSEYLWDALADAIVKG